VKYIVCFAAALTSMAAGVVVAFYAFIFLLSTHAGLLTSFDWPTWLHWLWYVLACLIVFGIPLTFGVTAWVVAARQFNRLCDVAYPMAEASSESDTDKVSQ